MTKANSKRITTTRLISNKTNGPNRAVRTTARRSAKPKPAIQSLVGKRAQSSAQQNGKSPSKQAMVIAMLRAPRGATIDAMARAMGWQQHSVRGFLAGVIRKKLSLNLVSAAAENGRIYRITDQKPASGANGKPGHAA